MQRTLSHPGRQRWLGPTLLAIVVPLLFAALPGEPLQMLAREASQVKQAGNDIATLRVVRTGFVQAHAAEPDAISARPTPAHTMAIAGVRRELNHIVPAGGPAGEYAAVLRDAIEGYAQAVLSAGAVGRYATPAMQPLPTGTSSHAIQSVLGQLQAQDEARLREPLLAMHLAEANLRSGPEPRSADQVSRWAETFAARLDKMAIPQGTRASLLTKLAAYQHAILSPRDALPVRQPDRNGAQAAVHTVETALVNADRAFIAEQDRRYETFARTGRRLVWSFGTALAASLLIVGWGIVRTHGRRSRHGASRACEVKPTAWPFSSDRLAGSAVAQHHRDHEAAAPIVP